jgi:hypothetical protein
MVELDIPPGMWHTGPIGGDEVAGGLEEKTWAEKCAG